jgi:hypothetical protein
MHAIAKDSPNKKGLAPIASFDKDIDNGNGSTKVSV